MEDATLQQHDSRARGAEGDPVPERVAPVPLAQKVAFLQAPDAYCPRPAAVESIETHMAWVFLTDQRAYKLKKPVRNAFRDFVTMAARKQSCLDEVRLNQRLAQGVYLGVVPLVVDRAGELALAGRGHPRGQSPGHPIDWLVEMRRLPASRMLDSLIRHDTVSEHDARRVGRKLARFYARATRVDMSERRYCRRLCHDIDATRRVLLEPGYGLPGQRVQRIAELMRGFVQERASLCAARARERRIVDGHGDLRPEHICLEDEPMIIDCIEFNDDLRVLDALSDLCFLALECQRLGAAWVGRRVLDTYAEHTGDAADPRLVRFYLAQHAYSRAKVAAWHLDDPHLSDPQRWTAKACRYLELAEEHAVAAG